MKVEDGLSNNYPVATLSINKTNKLSAEEKISEMAFRWFLYNDHF